MASSVGKEKRVCPVLNLKVYFCDFDQLDQPLAVVTDDEAEKETKKDDYTVHDLQQVMACLKEKKEKIEKITTQFSASYLRTVTYVEEEEKDKVEQEEEDDDDDDEEGEELEEEEDDDDDEEGEELEEDAIEKDKVEQEEEDDDDDDDKEEEEEEDDKEKEELEEVEKEDKNNELDDGWDIESYSGRPDQYVAGLRNVEKEKRDILLHYYEFFKPSRGFEAECPPPPGYCWASPIDLNDSSQLEAVNRMSKFAVEFYNTKYKEKGKMIEFVRVHHANICRACCDVYYITLLAKDLIKEYGEQKTYQAKVLHWNFLKSGESIYVHIFRPKPTGHEISSKTSKYRPTWNMVKRRKRVSPLLEIKVYFGDHDQLDQPFAVVADDEAENEIENEDDSVLDLFTVKDLEQIMVMLEEKKEKITKIFTKVSLSHPPLVMNAKEDEKDKVEEEDGVVEEEEYSTEEEGKQIIKTKGWMVELDDGWDFECAVHDPEEFVRSLRNITEEKRELLLYYHKIASASKGFDIFCPPPPGCSWVGPISSYQVDTVDRMAKYAVEEYNTKYKEKGKKIDFVRVHHANFYRPFCSAYFITLLAKDLVKDEMKTYQTKVVHWEWSSGNEDIHVYIFRPEIKRSS